MNTIVICATITVCVFIVCYYTNKLINKHIDYDNILNSMFDDMVTINELVNRSSKIDFYCESVKHNILTIKNISSKYVEEDELLDTSSEES